MAEHSHLHVTFFAEARQDAHASHKEGRPIFKSEEYARIRWAGDRRRELVVPAHERSILGDGTGQHMTWAEQFPEHYAVFQRTNEETVVGTPLEMLTFLGRTAVAELRASSVPTVEALAGVSDRDVAKLGPQGRNWREQARAWLTQAQDASAVNKVAEENAKLLARIAFLEAAAGVSSPSAPSSCEDMSEEQLRAYLAERGLNPKAKVSRDDLIAACRQMDAEAA